MISNNGNEVKVYELFFTGIVGSSVFVVPQRRKRLITIGNHRY